MLVLAFEILSYLFLISLIESKYSRNIYYYDIFKSICNSLYQRKTRFQSLNS